MKALVTGAAGFIGSNLVDRLLAEGHTVVGYDNLSTGRREFLTNALQAGAFRFVEGDLHTSDRLLDAVTGIDVVFHLAANADVRFGLDAPARDLTQNTIGTFTVLEAMRACNVRTIVFSSTGSVYGEQSVLPTPEDAPFPIQTSLYGASKLAGEAMIQAYCEGFGFEGYIFRFVSVLGERYSHGHVFDFCRSLRRDPSRLRILGNGRQRKSYLYVADCVEAVVRTVSRGLAQRARHRCAILNIGTDEYCEVRDSAQWICDHLGMTPEVEFTGGERGWVGDVPFIWLDISRLLATGWKPTATIRESVVKTVDWLLLNEWVFDARSQTGQVAS
jgi:UDP-glucose 4-epimerase